MTVTPGRGSDPTQRVQSLGFTARYLLLRLVNLLICTQSKHVVTDQSNCHRCVLGLAASRAKPAVPIEIMFQVEGLTHVGPKTSTIITYNYFRYTFYQLSQVI